MQSQITVRLDEEFHEQITNVAKRLRRKRSDIVRLALEKFISEIDGLNESKPYDPVKGLMGSASSGIPNLREAHREYHIRADALCEGGMKMPMRLVRKSIKKKYRQKFKDFPKLRWIKS